MCFFFFWKITLFLNYISNLLFLKTDQKAIDTLRYLFQKHEFDPRYQNKNVQHQIREIYFPLLLIVLDHWEIISQTYNENEKSSWLICFLWVLKGCSSKFIMEWWKKDIQKRKLQMFDVLSLCLDLFKVILFFFIMKINFFFFFSTKEENYLNNHSILEKPKLYLLKDHLFLLKKKIRKQDFLLVILKFQGHLPFQSIAKTQKSSWKIFINLEIRAKEETLNFAPGLHQDLLEVTPMLQEDWVNPLPDQIICLTKTCSKKLVTFL